MDIADILATSRKKAARLLFQLPRECRTFTAINPAAQWGWSESFLNKIIYLLELKLWQDTPVQKGKKAAHDAIKPKPFVPDFLKPDKPESDITRESETRTLDDVKSILALPRGV